LDSSHRVQAAVAMSLAGLHQRGIRIVLATARSPQLMEPVLTQLGFLPFLICFSGAWIGNPRSQSTQQQSFFERELSVSAAEQVINVASAYDLEPNVFYPYAWRVRRFTPEVKAESEITQIAPSLTPKLVEKAKGPSKILIISRPSGEADTLQRIANAISPFTTATFSKPNYLEVIAPGVNKARSLAMFAERLGLDSTVGIVAIVITQILNGTLLPPWMALSIGVIVGGLVGAVNGLGIAHGRIPPFIMTLGIMVMGRGLAMTLANGEPISLSDSAVAAIGWIGNGFFLGMPVPVWIFVSIALLASLTLRYAPYGRYVYAIGSSQEASRLSGIPVLPVMASVYIVSGVLAALTAIVFVTRLSVAEPTAGTGL
jgi:hydroxymethylpyrimidine pyrophosphatase-like HAD family hydrolase